MGQVSSDDVFARRIAFRNPFRIETLTWMSRLHRAAFRPRRRLPKRLVGRPAKKLFNLVFNLGCGGGRSSFAVRIGEEWRTVAFSPRNTQFGALYMPQNKPIYEPETSMLLDILIGDDDVFFDIGANWGYYALFIASRDGYRGRIEAFEPFPPTFRDLAATVEQAGLSDRIGIHGTALSDRDGTAGMAVWDGIQSGLARLGEARDSRTERVEVPMRRLDSFDLPAPDVIKIDAEDHEEAVLSGARDLLARARPMIVLENWLHAETPRLTLGPLRLLAEWGFRFFAVGWRREGYESCLEPELANSENDEAVLVLVPFLPESRYFLPHQLNVFAIPEERMDFLRGRFESDTRPERDAKTG